MINNFTQTLKILRILAISNCTLLIKISYIFWHLSIFFLKTETDIKVMLRTIYFSSDSVYYAKHCDKGGKINPSNKYF